MSFNDVRQLLKWVLKRNLWGRILAECVSKWPVSIEREVDTAVSFAVGEGAG